MATAKRRLSRGKSRRKRTHWRVTPPALTACEKCGSARLPHRVCSECGHYGGKKVLVTRAEKLADKALDKA